MSWFSRVFGKLSGNRKTRYLSPKLREQPAPPADPDLAEREARKSQSETRLRGEGVPISPVSPDYGTSSDVRLRTAKETADRLLALTLVAMKAEGLDHAAIQEIIDVRGARELFTPEEADFINTPMPSEEDMLRFSICYEAAWTLVWALRLVREPLSTPRECCDNDRLIQIVRDTPDLTRNSLREPGRVLDKLHLFYHYASAVRDAEADGQKPPANIRSEVALGRHWALSWLARQQENPTEDPCISDSEAA